MNTFLKYTNYVVGGVALLWYVITIIAFNEDSDKGFVVSLILSSTFLGLSLGLMYLRQFDFSREPTFTDLLDDEFRDYGQFEDFRRYDDELDPECEVNALEDQLEADLTERMLESLEDDIIERARQREDLEDRTA